MNWKTIRCHGSAEQSRRTEKRAMETTRGSCGPPDGVCSQFFTEPAFLISLQTPYFGGATEPA
jgi:hypothetical protein